MRYRKNISVLSNTLKERKIIFLLWPRQVWKTTLLKNIFDNVDTLKKLFLNLEIIDYHEYFRDYSSINNLLLKNWFNKNEKFYLFLDEFHKVKNIDWIIKSLFDEYENIRIILSWSNNIEINKNIKESFAWRKRVINMFPLDFEEYIVWKENINIEEVKIFIQNPLNNGKINFYLEEFMIWWGYPEVVLQEKIEDKKQVLQDIFSFWFNKDILIEIKETYKFNNFIKQLSIRNWGLLNLNEISTQVWVSQPTWEHYFDLMFKSLLLYPVRPFFTNKLKEIVKMPKFYFIDNWFRNFLMWRYEFIQDEKWLLFENFIFSELLKKWVGHENIKYWRTKNWVQEVDFILEYSKTAFETKFKDNISKKEFSWLNAFIKDYEWFDTKVISKNNFYDLKI